ncbi:DUF2141 domain-containing protein [Massilia sp.]|uniref:DUF2141 domain-containing protein n=1 Tax=Massilia sp. TaxID=1882437 RepID=UPI00289AE49C|nr:DUF2141 domain-containing protein [Massilia sp.]
MKVFRSISRSLFISAALAATASASAATIEVRVTGVVGGKGKVAVAVCDKDTFLKDCKYSATAPAKDGENVITVKDVPAGTWAVLSYQDENDNGKLDRNVVGIPKENYGFSRDARGRFGPPSFEEAAFAVNGETASAAVKLR